MELSIFLTIIAIIIATLSVIGLDIFLIPNKINYLIDFHATWASKFSSPKIMSVTYKIIGFSALVILVIGFLMNGGLNFLSNTLNQVSSSTNQVSSSINQVSSTTNQMTISPSESDIASSKIDTTNLSTVRIVYATGAFTAVTATNRKIVASPGQFLNGSVTLDVNNKLFNSNTPLIGTSSWGNHSTSWWVVNNWVTSGNSVTVATISLSAPQEPGIYYIIFAFRDEKTGGEVASATDWSVGHDVWNDGNDIADFNTGQIAQALQNGVTVVNWLNSNGYQPTYVPADVVEVIVR